MAGIQHKPVGVFWDIENCSVPRNKTPSDVIAHIRNFFVINRLNHREYEFIISCDVTRLRKDIPEDINKAGGVTLAHVNGSSKNAADEKLRENMKKFVDTHASVSPVLILISGDIDFVNDLRGYQTRLGCTVILIHATSCSPQIKIGWNEIYCFTSFCSAVKDNPALDSAANANAKKNPKKQTAGPPNPRNQGVPTNQKVPVPPNAKNQGGPPDTRFRPGDPRTNRQAQTVNKSERPSPLFSQAPNQKQPRAQFPMNNGMQHLSYPPMPPPLHQAPQFGQGNRNKPFNNGPNTSNSYQQQTQQNLKISGGNNPSVEPANEAPDTAEKYQKNKFILMVGGLPGKMDFKILKDNLQLQANKVQGKVKYVKNGQAFITFNNKNNADRAVELFNGKKVFGKSLNVSFTKNIPFEDQSDGKPKPQSSSEEFVMVEQVGATGGSKKWKNKDTNSGSSPSNGGVSNDPVLAGLGSIISGIVATRMAAANAGNKSPETCPVQ